MQYCAACRTANLESDTRCIRCGAELVARKDRHTFFLVRTSGAHGGERIEVPAAGLTVGSQRAHCSLLLEDANVSRTHARLSFSSKGTLHLADSSTTGTFLNGSRVSEAELKGGDKVRFGSNPECTFEVEEIVPRVIPLKRSASAGSTE